MTKEHSPRDCNQCGTRFIPKKNGAKMKYCSALCAANARQQKCAEWHSKKQEELVKERGIEDARSFGDYDLRARDYVKTYPEGHVENLTAFMSEYANLHGYKLNPDSHRVDMVIRGLLGRNIRYGLYFCPSRSLTWNQSFDATIVCPCVFLKDDIQYCGSCFCKLFVNKEEK
jgi:ferredoxin-thioredoxin reductase catalytic subunit